MLTAPERIAFVLLASASAWLALGAALRLRRVIGRGHGSLARPWPRLATTLLQTVTLRGVFRTRTLPSVAHALVAWGFIFYLVVNTGDLIEGFIEGFVFLGDGAIGDVYRLLGDLLSAPILAGMVALLLRRFAAKSPALMTREGVLLHPRARRGIRLDSAIVGGFILLHVGARFGGQSFQVAQTGRDGWRPLATAVSGLWSGLGDRSLDLGEHASWWLAIGLILLFVPYFPRSKHIHLFFVPLNLLLKPGHATPGQLDPLALDREPIGARRIEELSRAQLMDAYACIQCNRCQDVCPAYAAGTALSPAAIEVNKRYQLNEEGAALVRGGVSRQALVESVLTSDALWACTSCAACVWICPVGDEPLRDILDIRRGLVLNEGALPARAGSTLMNVAITRNPWGEAPSARAAWAAGLDVPLLKEVGGADVLYWVGCSAAYDGRNQSIARSVARLLRRAGVDFAVLGDEEGCTGDPARRMGDEALFQRMAGQNIEALARYRFNRIVCHCPHCLNVLKHEYPPLIEAAGDAALAARWCVVHHSQLLDELVREGRLNPVTGSPAVATFHDSCYLGRYNGEFEAPRRILAAIPGLELREMPRARQGGFCCGGGGGGAWVDVPAERRIADIRLEEALALEPGVVASACPFCLAMFEGSAVKRQSGVQLSDVAELLDAATAPA